MIQPGGPSGRMRRVRDDNRRRQHGESARYERNQVGMKLFKDYRMI